MKEPKPYSIILIKNGEVIPQKGLDYTRKSKADEVANYLNSLLPNNLRDYEKYSVIANNEEDDNEIMIDDF